MPCISDVVYRFRDLTATPSAKAGDEEEETVAEYGEDTLDLTLDTETGGEGGGEGGREGGWMEGGREGGREGEREGG